VSKRSFSPLHGLMPITVAVTGHRDIPKEDEQLLTVALREQLDLIASKHQHSPLVFLSGLAEGADRLAARCALDAGWSLGAVLPLCPTEYEIDFESAQSIAEFRDLMGQAAFVQVVSQPHEQVRPACYGALGRWFTRHALLLVAFWNGESNQLEGGTSETVREFLESFSRNADNLLETGPVIQIVTRRQRNLNAPIEVGKVIIHAQ